MVVTVTASGGYTQAVLFRVWYPTSVAIEPDDMTLNRVATPACTNGEAPLYQSTTLRAIATLSTTGGATMVGVDVTSHMAFMLAPSGGGAPTATLSGNVLRGLSDGDATIVVNSDSVGTPHVTVAVSDTEVTAVALDGIVVPVGFLQSTVSD